MEHEGAHRDRSEVDGIGHEGQFVTLIRGTGNGERRDVVVLARMGHAEQRAEFPAVGQRREVAGLQPAGEELIERQCEVVGRFNCSMLPMQSFSSTRTRCSSRMSARFSAASTISEVRTMPLQAGKIGPPRKRAGRSVYT